MNDPGLVVHKCCILSMQTSGIMPHSELSRLRSYRSMVSAKTNTNEWDMLCRSFLFALEPAGILITNGDEVSGVFEVDGKW